MRMSRVTDSELATQVNQPPPWLNFLVRKESQLSSDCRVLTGKAEGVLLTRIGSYFAVGFQLILGFLCLVLSWK